MLLSVYVLHHQNRFNATNIAHDIYSISYIVLISFEMFEMIEFLLSIRTFSIFQCRNRILSMQIFSMHINCSHAYNFFFAFFNCLYLAHKSPSTFIKWMKLQCEHLARLLTLSMKLCMNFAKICKLTHKTYTYAYRSIYITSNA